MPAVSARIYKALLSAREKGGGRRSDRSETTGRWKILINSSWHVFLCRAFLSNWLYSLGPLVMHYRSILFLIPCSTGFDSFYVKAHRAARSRFHPFCFCSES